MAEPVKTGSGKKFSITIQVPDDVAAQWPDRTTAEKLVQEVYTAMGAGSSPGASPPKTMPPRPTPPPPRGRRETAVVVLAALMAGGIGGYLGARTYLGPMASADRPAAPAPVRVEHTRPLPASPAQQPQADLSTTPATSAAQVPASPRAEQPAARSPFANPAAAYTVQVGAYRVRQNAEVLLLRLHQDGFQAQLVHPAGLYVVQLGPFQTRQDASQLVDSLKARNYDAIIVRFTPAGN